MQLDTSQNAGAWGAWQGPEIGDVGSFWVVLEWQCGGILLRVALEYHSKTI